MSDSAIIAKNTLAIFSGEIVAHALGFFITIILARYLGDAGFGVYSFAFAFASIMIIFSDLGVSTLMVREVSRKPKLLNNYASNIFLIKFILTIAIALILFIIVTQIESLSEVGYAIYWASFAMLFLEFSFFFRKFLHIKQIMEYEAIIKIFEKVITLLFLLLMFYLFKKITVFVAVVTFFVGYASTFLLSFYYAKVKVNPSIRMAYVNLDISKHLLKNSWQFWLTTVFIIIYFKVDTLMLSFMTSYESVGWYNAAYKLIEGLNFMPTLFIVAIFPAMSVLYVKNKQYLQTVFEKTIYYLLLLSIPIGVGVSLLASRFILLFYTSEYGAAIGVLQILIWAEVFVFVNYFMGFLLNSIDKQGLFTRTIFIGLIINVVLNTVLIPSYGIYGAAFATLATEIINFFQLFRYTQNSGYTFNILKTIYKPLLAALVMGIVIYFSLSLHLVLILSLAILTYFLVLFLTKSIGKNEFNLFLRAIKKLRQRN